MNRRHPPTWVLWCTVAVMACIYAWGLNNLYMPSNGDEMVYAHIARLTAASDQWLPLLTEIPSMRNTKPPLLFWQAMVASDWGAWNQLWVLRLPSLMYLSLVCAGMAALLHRWTGEWRTSAWAVLAFLACWGTFRYGRPYLTTSPEMFWYSLALMHVLWRAARPATAETHHTLGEWAWWTVWGLLLGVGLLYKSFALVAPVCVGLWAVRLVLLQQWRWPSVLVISLQLAWMGVLALALMASWLWFDPHPAHVWQDFVVGENVGKMNAAQGYWAQLFSLKGGVAYLTAYLQNAGLMIPWVLALLGLAWRHRRMSRHEGRARLSLALVVWLLVWWCVFLLPSQRSGRYLLPAMPALALLIALHVHDVGRWPLRAVALLSSLMLAVLAWLGWHAQGLGLLQAGEATLLALAVVGGGVLLAQLLWRSEPQPWAALVSVLCAYLGLNAVLSGLSGPAVHFQGATADRPVATTVWVPVGFNGEFERFQYLLPQGNRITPDADKVDALSEGRDTTSGTWFVVARPHGAPPLPCEASSCQRVAVRWDLELRLKPGQVHSGNIHRPDEWLWRQEWLMRVR